jgi:hypothetical protein
MTIIYDDIEEVVAALEGKDKNHKLRVLTFLLGRELASENEHIIKFVKEALDAAIIMEKFGVNPDTFRSEQ